jgi:polyphosphate kinase
VDGPLTFLHVTPLVFNDAFPELRDRPFFPAYDTSLPPEADVFEVLRREDVLLHHPYESFDSVVQLLDRAAADPRVLAIKMTLYRTSGDSPIVRALVNAANNGKQVTALVELKARFDEAANIQWARQLEEAGVHVVYGVVGLKVHCKALLIVRRDEDGIRRYAQLGTGNYHPRTARIYTDLSLLTTNPELTEEVAVLFNTLTGVTAYPGFKKMVVAPFDLFDKLKDLIKRERELAKAGKPGRIILKINSLVEEDLIRALYKASCAGVKIDLIVRGMCGLRPGIKGVSENIRVISIVGRFLEHSRIFYFGNNGNPQVFIGSADLMPRNLFRRIETVFPIENPRLKEHIEKEILPTYLSDRVKARLMQSDGTYVRLKAEPGQRPVQAQLTFREIARRQIAALAPPDVKTTRKLTPVEKPPQAKA